MSAIGILFGEHASIIYHINIFFKERERVGVEFDLVVVDVYRIHFTIDLDLECVSKKQLMFLRERENFVLSREIQRFEDGDFQVRVRFVDFYGLPR